jgi:hypothetical protein
MRNISSYHLLSLLQHMRLLLLVAFGAVKPFPALSNVSQFDCQGDRIRMRRTARGANRHLCVKNVFTATHDH